MRHHLKLWGSLALVALFVVWLCSFDGGHGDQQVIPGVADEPLNPLDKSVPGVGFSFERDMVRSLGEGRQTLVEVYRDPSDPNPIFTQGAKTRPLTTREREIVESQMRRHLDLIMKTALSQTSSAKTADFVQETAARCSIVETSAALECLGRGQAFVLLEGRGLRDSDSWTYIQHRIQIQEDAVYVTIAVDLDRHPDIHSYRKELANVERFSNDEICYEWNALDFGVRSRIIQEGRDAETRLGMIQSQLLSIDRRTPEGSDLWREWARLSSIAARMPRGPLGDLYEAIPGKTVFNGRSFR